MRRKDKWLYVKLFGLYIAIGRWFGNCFSPAIVLCWQGFSKPHKFLGKICHPAWATLTFRSPNHMETTIYWRGLFRFDWNSEYIAKRYGTYVEANDLYHNPDYWQYTGWLGTHTYI